MGNAVTATRFNRYGHIPCSERIHGAHGFAVIAPDGCNAFVRFNTHACSEQVMQLMPNAVTATQFFTAHSQKITT